jgi:hypothetical protein
VWSAHLRVPCTGARSARTGRVPHRAHTPVVRGSDFRLRALSTHAAGDCSAAGGSGAHSGQRCRLAPGLDLPGDRAAGGRRVRGGLRFNSMHRCVDHGRGVGLYPTPRNAEGSLSIQDGTAPQRHSRDGGRWSVPGTHHRAHRIGGGRRRDAGRDGQRILSHGRARMVFRQTTGSIPPEIRSLPLAPVHRDVRPVRGVGGFAHSPPAGRFASTLGATAPCRGGFVRCPGETLRVAVVAGEHSRRADDAPVHSGSQRGKNSRASLERRDRSRL